MKHALPFAINCCVEPVDKFPARHDASRGANVTQMGHKTGKWTCGLVDLWKSSLKIQKGFKLLTRSVIKSCFLHFISLLRLFGYWSSWMRANFRVLWLLTTSIHLTIGAYSWYGKDTISKLRVRITVHLRLANRVLFLK